jgi:hypothetical protein
VRFQRPGPSRTRRRSASAADRARDVVGLYGDPGSTWGIGLELAFDDALSRSEVEAGADALFDQHPLLGERPALDLVDIDWDRCRTEAVTTAYADDGTLVRLVLDGSGRRLLVAAHHGVCDGLGLVAVAAALSDRPLHSRARGIGHRRAVQRFGTRSVMRLGEALFRPPPRFPSHHVRGTRERGSSAMAEILLSRELPAQGRGTAALLRGVADAYVARGGRGEPLVIVGASRRSDARLEPDRQTAYLRIRVPAGLAVHEVERRLAHCAPEPDFPATALLGLGPALVRPFRGRLGATATVSNLGVIEGEGLRAGAMFAASSGPRAVVVGLCTTARTTTLTLRTRAAEYPLEQSYALLDDLVAGYLRGDSETAVGEAAGGG